MFAHRRSAAGSSSDARIAVFPFAYRGSEQFAYLGEGMVDLLSARLDGVGDLRSVDPRTLLSHVAREDPAPLDPHRGASVAERFSAGLYVLGSIVEAGGRLEVAASLYDASGRKRLGTTVAARDESTILEVVDEIARQIVAARYGEPGRRLAGRAAVTTRSIAALRAYLQGEAAFRAGAFDRAMQAFQDAVREDSGFALAYYRLSVAADWAGWPGADVVRRAAEEAMRRADRLSQHDRWLLQAWVAWRRGAAAEAEGLYRNIVDRYPDDVEAWFQLGEILFHSNPLRGRPLAEARVPFERVLAFEPENVGARLHLARIAAAERRMAELDGLVGRHLDGDPRELRILLLRALARGDTAEEARVLGELGQMERVLTPVLNNVPVFSRNLAGAQRVTRLAALRHRSSRTRTHAHLYTAYLAMGRGRWREARQEFTAAESLHAAHALIHHALTAALPFVAVSRAELRELRDVLTWRQGEASPPDVDERNVELSLYPQLRHYLLGLLAAGLGELDAAATHARALEDSGSSAEPNALVQDLARGLSATVAWREGRAEEALRILEGLNMELAYERVPPPPFLARTYERYLRAELLFALGQDEEALRWYRSIVELSADGVMYLAPSHLRRGEIYERRGELGRAMAHYARFVELWNDADPELQPAVEAVQQRLERLGREVPG